MAYLLTAGLDESLASLLECPVCLDYMSAPILMCSNGHNICQQCKSQVKGCPICRGTFSEARNFFAENVSERLLFPCDNARHGCPERLMARNLVYHSKVCLYRQYQCIPGIEYGCTWMGRRDDIYAHINKAHTLLARMKEENDLFISDMDTLDELSAAQLISAHGQIFWYRVRYNPALKKMFIVVQFLGPEENASKYKYTLRFRGRDNVWKLDFSDFTLSDMEDVEVVYRDGRCFNIDVKFMENFRNEENMIKFKFLVEKVCT